jgi:hypothetical protein
MLRKSRRPGGETRPRPGCLTVLRVESNAHENLNAQSVHSAFVNAQLTPMVDHMADHPTAQNGRTRHTKALE